MKPTVLNRILVVLGFAGIFVAGVLSLAEVLHKDVPCGMSSGCATVAQDPSSHMFGIPNAFIGLFAYVVFAGLAVFRELVGIGSPKGKITVNVGWLMAMLGTLASLVLTYIAKTQIHAMCMWCLTSAGIMILTLICYLVLSAKLDTAPTQPDHSKVGTILPPAMVVLVLIGLAVTAHGFTELHVSSLNVDDKVIAELVAPDAHVKNPAGELTLIEFGDLDCPTCKHTFPQLEQLVKNSNGKIRYIFHNFPLWKNQDHKGALWGAEISEIAAESGKFWEYLDAVYRAELGENAPLPDNTQMLGYAAAIGLDTTAIQKRLEAGSETDPAIVKVTNDLNLAKKCDIKQTPTFIVILKDEKVQVVGTEIFNVLDGNKYKPYTGV